MPERGERPRGVSTRTGRRDAGEQRDHGDGEDVLDDQDAEDQLGEALVFSLSSSSALTMMVVEEIDRIAPRNIESIVLQPKQRPMLVADPSIITTISVTAATNAVAPDAAQLAQAELQAEGEHQEDHAEFGQRAGWSARRWISANGGVCGPMMTPARM